MSADPGSLEWHREAAARYPQRRMTAGKDRQPFSVWATEIKAMAARRKKTMRDHLKAATQAHADLNTFAAIVALLESGLNSSDTDRSAFRIIAIAQAEQSRCLARLDRASARLGAPYDGRGL